MDRALRNTTDDYFYVRFLAIYDYLLSQILKIITGQGHRANFTDELIQDVKYSFIQLSILPWIPYALEIVQFLITKHEKFSPF